ncbi:MAG TPA: hypothetical protein VED63_00925, partial [Acidimicrobiales bacterium]|nr:hypothetical protein [Acidimicrobiales bacterium]
GILTGVMLLDLLRRTGRSLVDLASSSMRRLPQVLVSVTSSDPAAAVAAGAVRDAVADAERALGLGGRVLLRASGTEPLVRVMAEANDEETARRVVDGLVEVVRRASSSPATTSAPGDALPAPAP